MPATASDRIEKSGFDRIPATRRLEAFRMDSEGWAQELQHIERYVTGQ